MDKRKVLIYIAGRYSGNIQENIRKARQAAIRLWELGYTVFCPHLNTIHFENDCKCNYEDYVKGDLVILERSDALLMIEGWEDSKGAIREYEFAQAQNLPIFLNIEALEVWFNGKTTVHDES